MVHAYTYDIHSIFTECMVYALIMTIIGIRYNMLYKNLSFYVSVLNDNNIHALHTYHTIPTFYCHLKLLVK